MAINNDYNQDISHVESAKITKETLMKAFENSGRFEAMLSIFNAVNTFDDGVEVEENPNKLSSFGLLAFANRLDNGKDGFVNDWELNNNIKKYGNRFTTEVTKDDIKEFIDFANKNGKIIDEEYAKQESNANEKVAKKLGVPKIVIDKINNQVTDSWQLKVITQNGKRLIKASFDEKIIKFTIYKVIW